MDAVPPPGVSQVQFATAIDPPHGCPLERRIGKVDPYGFRDGIKVEHRNADLGSSNQAQ